MLYKTRSMCSLGLVCVLVVPAHCASRLYIQHMTLYSDLSHICSAFRVSSVRQFSGLFVSASVAFAALWLSIARTYQPTPLKIWLKSCTDLPQSRTDRTHYQHTCTDFLLYLVPSFLRVLQGP